MRSAASPDEKRTDDNDRYVDPVIQLASSSSKPLLSAAFMVSESDV